MTDLINGRTPEKIRFNVMECAHGHCLSECPYDSSDECTEDLLDDAFALIRHLESERDAAFRDIPHDCGTCKYWQDPPKIYENKDDGLIVEYCDQDCSGGFPGWVWRGVVKPPEEENV